MGSLGGRMLAGSAGGGCWCGMMVRNADGGGGTSGKYWWDECW